MDANPKRMAIGVFLAMLSVALAGCTGEFNIDQTEPFRIQVDDSEPETVEVAEDDDEPRRVIVENKRQAEQVDVEVKVTPRSDGPVTVIVKIVEEDNDEVILAEEEIRVQGDDDDEDFFDRDDDEDDDNNTGGNETGNETQEQPTDSPDGDNTVIIQDIDIRGKDNFVVLTQALEGDADVDILTVSAQGSAGNNTAEGNQTGP